MEMSFTKLVVGQAGRRDVGGHVVASVLDDAAGDIPLVSVSLPTAYSANPAMLLGALAPLPLINIVDLEVVEHSGDDRNDHGFGVHTGYSVGHYGLLGGVGTGVTWIFRYVPSDLVAKCVDAGSMSSAPTLKLDTSAITGTDAGTRLSLLRQFRCTAVRNTVANHTNAALRVHLASLGPYLLGSMAQYDQFLDVLRPAALWRSPDVDAFGTTTTSISSYGWFPGSQGAVVGSVTTTLGFTAVDPDPAFLLPGGSDSFLLMPFRYACIESGGVVCVPLCKQTLCHVHVVINNPSAPARVAFNLPIFTIEFWLKPSVLSPDTDGSVVLCSSALPDDLTTPSNGYLVVLDPCGTLSVLLGTGRSTAGATALTPLTGSLTKPCSSYLAEIASSDFPWMVARAALRLSTWQHVCIQYSQLLSRLSVFVDAEVVSSQQYPAWKYQPNFVSRLTVGGSAEPEVRLQGLKGTVDNPPAPNYLVVGAIP